MTPNFLDVYYIIVQKGSDFMIKTTVEANDVLRKIILRTFYNGKLISVQTVDYNERNKQTNM